MGERRGQAKSPEFVVGLVVNRLRHTILPALDTVSEAAAKIKTDLIITGKSLLEIAGACKESDPSAYQAIMAAANSISESAYQSRKLGDDLDKFVSDQVRGQATALSRIDVRNSI